jgi:hypothetical protein
MPKMFFREKVIRPSFIEKARVSLYWGYQFTSKHQRRARTTEKENLGP